MRTALHDRNPDHLGQQTLHGAARLGPTRDGRGEWASASPNPKTGSVGLHGRIAAELVQHGDRVLHPLLQRAGPAGRSRAEPPAHRQQHGIGLLGGEPAGQFLQ